MMKRNCVALLLASVLLLAGCGNESAVISAAPGTESLSAATTDRPAPLVSGTLSAGPAEAPWYAEAVEYVLANGLMDSMENGEFAPDDIAPRGLIAESLWRAAGGNSAASASDFADVDAANPHKAAIDWAAEQGIVNGYGNGLFGVSDSVTRQDFSVMLWRAAGRPSAAAAVTFADAESIAAYAREAVAWAQEKGIIEGVGSNRFDSRGTVTRAQVAAILQRYLAGRENGTEADAAEPAVPAVYFTSDISPEGLTAVYQALDWTPSGAVAVKVSTGEPPASNYLRPELIGDLVKSLDGTIVECNTAYGGSRSSSAMHKQVAADHGFTAIADFDLLDEEGETEWPVTGGTRLSRILVGSHSENYADWLILSHFKGHAMAGFGGAIKNVGIGASSASGKVLVHTAGSRTSGSIWYSDQDAWLEALAEMVDGFVDHVGAEHIVYINVMNRLSVDCDCDGNPAEPDIHDIGILASADPVALDQACCDLLARAEGNAALMNRIERQHGLHTLEHAEEIGLGSRTYQLISIKNTGENGNHAEQQSS